jgi:hypothetical protein
MAMPPPPTAALAAGPINPFEAAIMSVNTNTYMIGLAMILLNLGGRHLALGLTPEQDRFFQNTWIRRAMLFVVIFVATRNIFTALWLSVGLILVIGYLLNEHSDLYIFGPPRPLPPTAPPTPGLSPEEQNIFKTLQDKVNKAASQEELKKDTKEETKETVEDWYKSNMAVLRTFIS